MTKTSTVALAVMLAGAPGLALAQPPAARQAPAQSSVPPAETLLHLSADGSVQAAPDELVADLLAEDSSASAADAQRRINALIEQGMQAAHAVPGINARAVAYQVLPMDEKRTKWLAQQTLELRGPDGPALLDLANRLQQQGFVTASLDWRLSPASRRKAFAEATTVALKALQAEAASAAATLGLRVDHLKDVQLLPPGFQPVRPIMGMAMTLRAGASAPQATAAPEDVAAQVSAEVVLRP
jgi:predicted secreted protein